MMGEGEDVDLLPCSSCVFEESSTVMGYGIKYCKPPKCSQTDVL